MLCYFLKAQVNSFTYLSTFYVAIFPRLFAQAGLDIGGTSVKGGLVKNGVVLFSKIYPLVDRNVNTVMEVLTIACQDILKNTQVTKDEVIAVGLCAPGLIDSNQGTFFSF